ncbi:MAG TPA: sugar transferase, partial [Anaerolineae bacterium]|nr:sugar transferase [Anaerolineae bacterium]
RISERRNLLITIDLILVNLSALLALYLGAQRSRWGFDTLLILRNLHWFLFFTITFAILAAVNDAHDLKVAVDPVASTITLIKLGLQQIATYALIYFFAEPGSLPRHIVGFFGLISPPTLLLWRLIYGTTARLPALQRNVIIAGAGWAGQMIAKAISEHVPVGLRVVGFVDDDPEKINRTLAELPVLGRISRMASIVRRENVSEIIVAITHQFPGHLLQQILQCYEDGLQITPMPSLYEQLSGRVLVEHVGNRWDIVLPISLTSGAQAYQVAKRAADVLLSLVGLTLFAPLLPFIALAIRLDSPGPVFLRQDRVGQRGRVFKLIKFRSMVPDAEKDGVPQWAQKNDQRVTRVGRFLRRTHIDELPQLINVLRGDMSFVGPRPERPEFVSQLEQQIPFYRARLVVRPGLTGWAQVRYRYGSSVQDALVKLQYDLYYIKHQSLYLDLQIVLRTIGVVLRMEGI